MKSYTILKIQRIQNPSLWKVFQWLVFVSSSLRGGSLQELVSCIFCLGKERHYHLSLNVTSISFLGAVSGVKLSVQGLPENAMLLEGGSLCMTPWTMGGGVQTERHK